MCIIIYKGVGKTIPKDHILHSFESNPDGAGIMWVEDGSVHIKKGFMDVPELLTELEKHDNFKDTDLCIHFRYATHGETKAGNCHPFPISEDPRDLLQTEMVTPTALAHNGIITEYGLYQSTLSDTQLFVLDLARGYDLRHILDGGKFCIFNAPKGQAHLLGHFIEEDGIYYSNGTFRGYIVRLSSTDTWKAAAQQSSYYGSLYDKQDDNLPRNNGCYHRAGRRKSTGKWTRVVKTKYDAPQDLWWDPEWADWDQMQELLVSMGASNWEIKEAYEDFLADLKEVHQSRVLREDYLYDQCY